MTDAALSRSPESARLFEISDERLTAELKKSSGNTPAQQPVGELLDRHWEAVFSYARLCTNGVRPAGMLTTAAFTRLFGESLRQTGPTAAWRPQLLVTVRRMVAEWLVDQRRGSLHPGLPAGSGPDGAERAMALLLPPESRRLLSRAFQRLPEPARCLLWHVEVEAEQLGVPAALLGISEEAALVELQRARERLREGCLEVHRELAPDEECRRYHRMLDVSLRRVGAELDPDLSRHMGRCDHCRYTADQLSRFNGELAVPLAESVLGWGAADYVASRPGRTTAIVEVTGEAPGDPGTHACPPRPGDIPLPPSSPPRPAARHASPADGRPASHKAPRRPPRHRNIALAALTAGGLILVPLVLWAAQSGDGGTDGADASRGPSAGPAKAPGAHPSWIGDPPNGAVHGRLRNVKTGLCVGAVGEKPVKGAETEMTSCSSAAAQEWSYEEDGLLRDAADPGLCLDSHLGYSVQLASCTDESGSSAKDVRYDFTRQGALVPRGNQDLALSPAATNGSGALVLKLRKEEAVQHWTLDTSSPSPQMESVNWGADGAVTGTATAEPKSSRTSSGASRAPSAPSTPTPTPHPSAPAYSCSPYSCTPSSDQGGYPGDGYGGHGGHGGHGHDGGSGGYGSDGYGYVYGSGGGQGQRP